MDLSNYQTVGEWYKDTKALGYSVPLQLCHCLTKLMQKYNYTLSEAFMFLIEKKKVMLKGKMFFFDLSANNLL